MSDLEKTKIVKGCCDWDAVCVEIIYRERGYGATENPMTSYVTKDDVDRYCKQLSKLLPACQIRISMHARIRAVYEDGVRTITRCISDFYIVDDEDIVTTRIYDQDKHEWF